ncbi:unnamed protein product, partial [Prorocentrum cordatum]
MSVSTVTAPARSWRFYLEGGAGGDAGAIDPAQAGQAKAEMGTIDPDARAMARRAVALMKKADPAFACSEDAFATWRALRAVPPKGSRVAAALLKTQRTSVQRAAAAGKKCRMQCKSARPHPGAWAFVCLVNPRDFPDLPSGVGPGSVWVAQWKCDPEWLGGDTRYINCEAAVVRTTVVGDRGGSGLPPAFSCRSPAADAPSPSAPGRSGPAEPDDSTVARASEAGAAADSEGEGAAVTAKKLCEHLKACAGQQRIAKAHVNDAGSGQFWAGRFTADSAKQTPPLAPRDVSAQTFILKTLRGAPCYDDLAPFADVVEEWAKWQGGEGPEASTLPLGRAIFELRETPVEAQIELGAPLAFKEQRKFLSSPIVRDFQRKQLARHIEVLRGRCRCASGRAGELFEIAGRIGARSQLQEVSLARAAGGNMPGEKNVKCLFAEPERCGMLRPRWPKSEFFDHMREVLSAKNAVEYMQLDGFMRFAPRAFENEELLGPVARPTTRAVLMAMKHLSARASTAAGSDDRTGLVAKAVGRALCAGRLRLQGNADWRSQELEERADMWECTGKASKKISTEESASLGPLARASNGDAERAAKASQAEKGAAAASQAEKGAAKGEAKPTEDIGEKGKDEGTAGKLPADEAAGAPDPKRAKGESARLKVGDIVFLGSLEFKGDWENCKAK